MILGTYHGYNLQYIDLIVEEFTWKYNNRFERSNLKKMKKIIQLIMETEVQTASDFTKKYQTLYNSEISNSNKVC